MGIVTLTARRGKIKWTIQINGLLEKEYQGFLNYLNTQTSVSQISIESYEIILERVSCKWKCAGEGTNGAYLPMAKITALFNFIEECGYEFVSPKIIHTGGEERVWVFKNSRDDN